MSRDETTLADILRAARLVVVFADGMDIDAFLDDLKTQSAVLHQFMITGLTRSPSGGEGATNQLLPARGGRAVGVAPGRLAAAGGHRGMRGGCASPHPSTACVLSPKRTRRFSPPPSLPPLGGGAGLSPPAGEGWGGGRHLRCNRLPLAQGDGETRFPHPPTRWEGLGGRSPPRNNVFSSHRCGAGVRGNPVSPDPRPAEPPFENDRIPGEEERL